jgi:hypothetical protein
MINVDATNYADLRKRLRAFSRDLDKELTQGLTEAGSIGVQAVKTKVSMVALHPTSRGRHGTARRSRGLRQQIAANTRTQVRKKDVRIVQGAKGLTGKNAKGLPRRLDGDQPFTHPAFGRAGTEVSQRPWGHFTKTIIPKAPAMTERVVAAMERAAEHLASE